MKILVTGASGFLGSHLCPRLAAQGHSVRALARSARTEAVAQAFEGNIEWVRADLHDREAVRRALDGVDALYHLAGQVSFRPEDAQRMYALHVHRTRELLTDAVAAKVGRVVLASTSGTIAVSRSERIGTEADGYPIPVVGRWPYYVSKIYEEKLALELCRKHGVPLVVLNPSLLLGPGDERLSSTWTVMKFLSQDIPAMPNGGISFVDVRDAADAFVAALTKGEVQGRHLMGVNMPFTEFYGRLSRMTGVPAPRLRLSSSMNVLGARVLERWAKAREREPALAAQEVEIGEHFFYLDASKAERELGFHARDPHETLFDTVQHLLAKIPPRHLPGTKGRLHSRMPSGGQG